jgi:hypothetical protein
MKEDIDDSRVFEMFRVVDKYEKRPDELTLAEKSLLRALGLEVE